MIIQVSKKKILLFFSIILLALLMVYVCTNNKHVQNIVHNVELEPTDHPLAIEQRNGITLERVKEIQEIIQRHN